jgi:hypothetical protein
MTATIKSILAELRLRRFVRRTIPEPNSGCWLWLGASNGKYGTMRGDDGRQILAHRYSYTRFVCDPGLHIVLHKCDVTLCVNPAHLRAGTFSENARDYWAKVANPTTSNLKTRKRAPRANGGG